MGADRQVDYYDDFYRELAAIDARGNDYSKIADLVGDAGAGRRLTVVDVGSGHGSVSAELARRGHQVVGLEVGREALASLKQLRISGVRCDVTRRLPLADAHADVVLLLDVLEHVFQPLTLLQEARRILRPGGFVIVTVPLYFDIVDRLRILWSGKVVSYDNRVYGARLAARFRSYNYDHIRFFRPADVDEMMTLSGLEVRQRVFVPLASSSPFPFLPVLRFLAWGMPGLFAHSMKVRASKP